MAKRGRPAKVQEETKDDEPINGMHIVEQDGKHYVYSGPALLGAYDSRDEAVASIPQ